MPAPTCGRVCQPAGHRSQRSPLLPLSTAARREGFGLQVLQRPIRDASEPERRRRRGPGVVSGMRTRETPSEAKRGRDLSRRCLRPGGRSSLRPATLTLTLTRAAVWSAAPPRPLPARRGWAPAPGSRPAGSAAAGPLASPEPAARPTRRPSACAGRQLKPQACPHTPPAAPHRRRCASCRQAEAIRLQSASLPSPQKPATAEVRLSWSVPVLPATVGPAP